MQFYRNWVALDVVNPLLVLWLLVALLILAFLLWVERERVRRWLVSKGRNRSQRSRPGKKRKKT